jgi:heparosan-N-sulfate-glucuronate 5-epimerase
MAALKARSLTFRVTLVAALACLSVVTVAAAVVVYRDVSRVGRPIRINSQGSRTNVPGPYWISLVERKYQRQAYVFDSAGVPLFEREHRQYYHPVYIGLFALGAYEAYLKTGEPRARDDFLKSASWFHNNLVLHGRFFYWEYRFPNHSHAGVHKVPWVSAMAQGIGVSVLVRAMAETGDQTYLVKARAAIEPMLHDLTAGGVSAVVGDGYIFPQEIPSDPPHPPSNILNGAISAYLGIYDYYRITSDASIQKEGEKILKSFASVLDKYDAKYWSFYCLWPKYLASHHYHQLHASQLRILFEISGDQLFLRYAEKFERYQNDVTSRVRFAVSRYLQRAVGFASQEM